MRYLLAAEADKIQDFIFRSSRLREVVGASQLLSRFCDEGAPPLLKRHGGSPSKDILVNDGGSFRVVFQGAGAKERAIDFGVDLAELYRLSVGGTLSVAEPVEMNGKFRDSSKNANKALRQTKDHRPGAGAEIHMPFTAFCASCGVALADHHGRLSGEPDSVRQRYLCRGCQTKARERDRKPRAVLDRFHAAYCSAAGMQPDSVPDWPEDADDVAGFDLRQRNYVAYLVADGNSMGMIFGECDEDQIRTFSEKLPHALNASLAETAAAFRAVVPSKGAMVPILPLILGGDDLFALIPSPYALDFARCFCLVYERELEGLVHELEIDVPKPTVAAAVVVCKSKYPYALAHRRGEELLGEAKRQSKLLAAHSGEHLSAVTFEVILGNRLAGQEEVRERRNAISVSLRPYWAVAKDAVLSDPAQEYGISLYQLLDQRLYLKDVPHKRLAELRKHFADLPPDIAVADRHEKLEAWTKTWNPFFERCGRAIGPRILQALSVLGTQKTGNYEHHWRDLYRDGESVLAHGMLDLLEAWDFAQALDHRPEDYEAEELE